MERTPLERILEREETKRILMNSRVFRILPSMLRTKKGNRRLERFHRKQIGEIFGYKGDLGALSAQEATILIMEDTHRWTLYNRIESKLIRSSKQSLKAELS